jgi:hypothetical protein
MKTISIFSFILFILGACSFPTDKKIAPNFVKITSQGLDPSKVEVLVEGSVVNSNIFDYGSEIEFVFKNMEGFTEEKGKRFPGMTITILNTKNDTLFFVQDIYEEMNGTDKFPLTLFAKLTAANPMFSNTKLIGKIHIWDKKGTSKLDADFTFSTRPNPNVHVKAKVLTYQELYIFSAKENKVIPRKTFPKDDNIMFIIEGLEGFKVDNGRVFPALNIQVKNETGEVVLEEENLFKSYEIDGIDPLDLKERMYFNINTVGTNHKELKIHAVLVDLKSDAALMLDSELFREEK